MDPNPAPAAPGVHTEHEDHPWTIQIPDHEKRTESTEYVQSRAAMNAMATGVADFEYGPAPYEDHHGGGLWLMDGDGWFVVRNLVGIEWSAQFCADPAKIDRLRVNARRLYGGFPDAVTALGIRTLLDTPIVDADGVKEWTDSICNASVPLPKALHVGVIPGSVTGGVHHYPSPIAEIELIKRDDFQLWVTTEQGGVAAVVPVAAHGSGDGRVRLLLAAAPPPADVPTPIDQLVGPTPVAPPADIMFGPAVAGVVQQDVGAVILGADHPLSRQAFARQ